MDEFEASRSGPNSTELDKPPSMLSFYGNTRIKEGGYYANAYKNR